MSRLDILKTNAESIIGDEDMMERIRAGKKLKIKLGVDPTRPDLTFGHMVVFNKMKQFQAMGHECILLIGDYTATIGDPSGRSETRPVLTDEEVQQNSETYLDQAFQILDENKTTVRYNSEWFRKMDFSDALSLTRQMTVARMLERDDFAKRYASRTPISIVEFLYPLIQGYDSVMLQADVELGGSDQLFNMLVGRALQKNAGQPEQTVITMPLLVGLDGVKKMSKSLGNYITFNDSAKDMFGKIMSINDETMWDYYRLLLEVDGEALKRHKLEHPMEAKKHLAVSLTAMFHSLDAANHERQQFEQVFSRNKLPDDMPVFSWREIAGEENQLALTEVLSRTKLFPSKKEVRRLIEQGAVKLNEEKADDPFQPIEKPEQEHILQAGKRIFVKIVA
ncbi:tyrosine--tRNA ligase [Ruficoccus amylovorans]|uniref:Tyrosine--tRNA ligase n=1 Tax=Ruficoccus amylovorans TaxID=1804625 RepID=A0A842HH55_9BACT|nr:tyrosine--tRNA ligase [Ruficoccus amylovorans]MBC2594571.1 tyrosine--tRNA ligase [Ruficoccus amylovorans]